MTQDEPLQFNAKGSGPAVVFSHGTPTYSGEYDAVISFLESYYRCIQIDHLGFGHSPKPFRGDYSLDAHQRRFRATLMNHGVKTFHLVVHDFGGVIALPLLEDPEFEILSLTILNSWYWPLVETQPELRIQKILFSTGFMVFLYRYFNFSARVLLKMAWGSYAPLITERHAHFMSMFPTRRERSGTIGFLHALFDFDHLAWKKSAALNECRIPVQIIWGKADPFISIQNLMRWIQIFPQAKVTELETVGHFVADESPECVAFELKAFFSGISVGAEDRT